ncbi:hypothetical protein [Nocardioides perillae]|uniref:Uncharacterized protein n=1 Tax=Nocardioides perillae TaxID=1119534 RepID=A0A7Y9RQZ7_9ACTN|nr:hypothetical protein [Nocardioides perillae]NYG54952.1 hypothetical protein [Nocardioides perillae]
MPIPLIAAGLIAAGAASGGGGLALGGKGARDLKKANDRLRGAARRPTAERDLTEAAVARTNAGLQELGEQQDRCLQDVVLRMGEFLRRHARQVKESERLLVDGIDATVSAVPGTSRIDADAVAWVRGAVTTALAGTTVSAGVTGAVGTFGVASTGAAISGLSGAAAESATLAFLGGGSLASGGGGMALGATALNFVTLGPAVLVGGLVVANQGTKALTKAREYEARIEVTVAELSATRARLEAIDARVAELADLLERLRDRGTRALDLLESEPFEPDRHVDRFQAALTVAMAVRDVAATPVVDGAGDLNDRTATFSVKYRPMTEEPGD